MPSLTAAFYVNNAVRNTHFIERRELTHVWLNHGDSEKPACYNPVHAIYDKIFAAGQAGIDRYARHGVTIPSREVPGGRAGRRSRASSRPAGRSPRSSGRRCCTPRPGRARSPTRGSTRCREGAQIVRGCSSRGVTVIFRPHPFNRRYAECVRLIAGIERLLRRRSARRPAGRTAGAPGRAGDEHRGLLQRQRRDDRRRLGRGLGLPALRQAVLDRVGRPDPGAAAGRSCRPPGPRTCCARTCPTLDAGLRRPARPRSAGRGPGRDPALLPRGVRPTATTPTGSWRPPGRSSTGGPPHHP